MVGEKGRRGRGRALAVAVSVSISGALAVGIAGCSDGGGANGTSQAERLGGADPHANPPSERLPDAWIDRARSRTLVAVAGANAGTQLREWMASGWGADDAPLHRVQSLEAVTAIYELVADGRTTILAWGWGDDVDTSRDYVYEAISGKRYAVRFIAAGAVATAYGDLAKFNEEGAMSDAKALRAAVDSSDALRAEGRDVMYVGCSWGGGVIDYGKTRTPSRGTPSETEAAILGDAPSVAIASPLDLPTLMQPWPFVGMSHTGEHGSLLVVRRPDDAVGQGGLHPLQSSFAGPTHNYTFVWHTADDGSQVTGGFWGLSGAGLLCPAAYADDCPFGS